MTTTAREPLTRTNPRGAIVEARLLAAGEQLKGSAPPPTAADLARAAGLWPEVARKFLAKLRAEDRWPHAFPKGDGRDRLRGPGERSAPAKVRSSRIPDHPGRRRLHPEPTPFVDRLADPLFMAEARSFCSAILDAWGTPSAVAVAWDMPRRADEMEDA